MSETILRPMHPDDLDQALAIQSQAYPAFLIESAAAFASRLSVAAPYCLAAERDGVLLAYLLAHGWPSREPPPVNAVLDPERRGDALFLHDLAVSGAARGAGIGEALVAHALASATADGLVRAELIAVEGAAAYWRRLGFADETPSPALAAKVAGYGPAAAWMSRSLAAGNGGFGAGGPLG